MCSRKRRNGNQVIILSRPKGAPFVAVMTRPKIGNLKFKYRYEITFYLMITMAAQVFKFIFS
jgi:hypothetical protein